MKKVIPLVSDRHKPARVVEQIKAEVRKYLKRERKKTLPEGYDFWGFDCRSGKSGEESAACHEKEISKVLDAALAEGWAEVYLEILAKPVQRKKK